MSVEDQVLTRVGHFSGTITLAGSPVEGVSITAYDEGGIPVGSASTNGLGRYDVAVNEWGSGVSYRVCATGNPGQGVGVRTVTGSVTYGQDLQLSQQLPRMSVDIGAMSVLSGVEAVNTGTWASSTATPSLSRPPGVR